MKTIAFFNNKGGVGKTTLLYHVAWMLRELGYKVLVMDLDPQANISSMFIDEEQLEEIWTRPILKRTDDTYARHIYQAMAPIEQGTGDKSKVVPFKITSAQSKGRNGLIDLIPGHLGLSRFEDTLSDAWIKAADGKEADLRTVSVFYRILIDTSSNKYDFALMDVGPNLGAINRCALISCDGIVIPMVPDLFSLQGLQNLGPTLRDWKEEWDERLRKAKRKGVASSVSLPDCAMQPLGYVLMQHNKRSSRMVKSFQRWTERIPSAYRQFILGQGADDCETLTDKQVEERFRLGDVKNYFSLMPMAQESRKPIFMLTAADGAIGAHQNIVRASYADFKSLAMSICQAENAEAGAEDHTPGL